MERVVVASKCSGDRRKIVLVWTHAGSRRPRWTDIEIERVREMEIERAIDRDIHTLYPLEKKRSAKARPMPLEAPVTRHTLAALIEINK